MRQNCEMEQSVSKKSAKLQALKRGTKNIAKSK